MKKIIILTVVLVFAMSAMALAADVTTYANPLFHASSKVTVRAKANASSFAAISKHLNGTRTYGTASDSTNIVYTEATGAGSAITSDPNKSDSTEFSSGWTSL